MKEPSRGGVGDRAGWSADGVLAALYCFAHLVFFSTLGNALGTDPDRLALLTMAATIVLAIAVAAWRGEMLAAGLSSAMLALVAVQLAVFSGRAGIAPNWNAGLAYAPLAGFIVFFNARRQFRQVVQLLVGMAIAYCAVYIVLADRLVTIGGPGILSGDARGPRLVLANGYAGLAIFYCLSRLRKTPWDWRWMIAFAVVLLAFVEAQSRAFSAVTALIATGFLLGLLGPAARWTLAVGFALATTTMLAGVAVPEWNPFAIVAWDMSGQARAVGYVALQPFVSADPLTGIGLPASRQAFAAFVGQDFVFWEDQGALGIWAAFGLAGLVAFLTIAFRCILATPGRSPEERALALATLAVSLFGVMSPSLWSGSGSVLANLVVALWLGGQRVVVGDGQQRAIKG